MRISEWSSDVCSSDLHGADNPPAAILKQQLEVHRDQKLILHNQNRLLHDQLSTRKRGLPERNDDLSLQTTYCIFLFHLRSEEHTSELQSLMRISYAVFCLKKKNNKEKIHKLDHSTLEISHNIDNRYNKD